MPYDLFISYARRDNEQGRITQLVERIKTDFAPFAKRELVPFFDQQEIHGMSDWRQRILQGLRESRLLLACLSPAYLQSEYCEWEFVEYLKYEIGHLQGFNGVAPIYFIEVPGWDSKEFEQQCAAWIAELRKRQHFDLRPWHDQGEAALRETAVQERMGKLNRQIVQTITRGERAEKSLGNVDAHNPHFIGRTANLRMLRENFVTPGHIGVVTAVNGVGGLGKTALAIEYAHAFADEYGGGRWQVRCAGKDDLRLALAELATPIGFKFTDDEKKNADLQFERTRRELKKLADAREPHRCLLLLDNVARPGLLDPAQVARLNGGDWLHVLATTRLGENELHGAHRDRSFLAIDELPPDDALALIESYQPDGRFRSEAERDAAREIVRLLGCFTLAVESSAVYLGQFANDVTCAAFLARLKKEGLEGLDTAASQSSEGVLHGEKRLSATLRPTLERLGAAEKLALEFAALLPPDQVPLPWLRALVAKTFPEMERDAEPGYPDPWKNVLRRLFSLRLIQATDEIDADGQPRVVRVHRLMQQLMFRDCPATERATQQELVDQIVRERNAVLESAKNWSEARWELEPLTALANLWDESKHPQAVWLINQMGQLWDRLAVWPRAEPLIRRALVIDENILGKNHPKLTVYLKTLGWMFHKRNRLDEAESFARRALAISETSYGPDHPDLAESIALLAGLMREKKNYAEAEVLFRRILTIDENWFGKNHGSVARDLNNLATLLRTTNRPTDAEPLFRRAIEICENFEIEDTQLHSSILNNFGLMLKNTNRLVEAEPLLRRALAIRESWGVENHPDIAQSCNNLATLLVEKGVLDEAEILFRRAIIIQEKCYDVYHPVIVATLMHLANMLQSANRLIEAEPLIRRALAIDEKQFGMDNPKVAKDINNLANVLKNTNRLAEAETLLRRVIAIFEKIYGVDDPNFAVSLNNLADLLGTTNRLTEAEPLMRRAVEILLKDSKTTGQQNPHLQSAIGNYTSLLRGKEHSPEEIFTQLNAIGKPFGFWFDSK